MGQLDEKVAIVTGGSEGLGEAIVRRYLLEGARVVIASRTPGKAERLIAALSSDDDHVVFRATDVRSSSEVEGLVADTVERWGGLDVMVNNAGVGMLRSVTEMTDEEYDFVMDVNVRGVFLSCKHAVPAMLARGGGSIINMASVASFTAARNEPAYCASKGAVLQITRAVALDYADQGIRVNAICPGFIETFQFGDFCANYEDPEAARREISSFHPMGRIGQPREVAGAAVFLAGEDSSFITGSSIVIDGGLMIKQGTQIHTAQVRR